MRHFVIRWVTGLSFLLGLVLFSSTPALAQDGGIRGGISVDPDQFYFGGTSKRRRSSTVSTSVRTSKWALATT